MIRMALMRELWDGFTACFAGLWDERWWFLKGCFVRRLESDFYMRRGILILETQRFYMRPDLVFWTHDRLRDF